MCLEGRVLCFSHSLKSHLMQQCMRKSAFPLIEQLNILELTRVHSLFPNTKNKIFTFLVFGPFNFLSDDQVDEQELINVRIRRS